MLIEDNHHQQQPKRIEASESVLTLPTEIIFQILSRLPVDTLLRCRSVCKLWRSIISDPYFIKSHLSISTSNTNYSHHRLFISTQINYIQRVIKGPKVKFKTCHLYHVLYANSINGCLNIYYPYKPLRESVLVVGSCNGLVCMANEDDALFLWNPSTRKLNALPCCDERIPVGWLPLYGFGYEESTDDYKVVKLFCYVKDRRTNCETFVWIYSLRNGNWKKIGAFPHGFPLLDYGMFSNGALHWFSSKDFFGSSCSWTTVSLELENQRLEMHSKDMDVWVMKEYGDERSWSKVIKLDWIRIPCDYEMMPVCFTQGDDVVIDLDSWNLVRFNIKENTIKRFKKCSTDWHFWVVYTETSVSPYG